ncbi:MAG: isoprenoid biosynthesis protein ElbB [Bdellovibrio sp.]|nr:MAG: isoprenoid biosynthesis protein ElbB [Bdellovibrio sp.]
MKAKRIAVALAGCGNKDGTEITEAVSLIVGLSRLGVRVDFFAPDRTFEARNFLNDTNIGTRNMMIEAARITRSNMMDLNNLNPTDYDALAFPGGFGAALHLSDWARKGSACEVMPAVKKPILAFNEQQKPIAAICIAPVLLAKVLGGRKVTVTIGNDKETIGEILKTGAQHQICPVDEVLVDRTCKVITTPAYMYGSAKPHEVFIGIEKLAKELAEMA